MRTTWISLATLALVTSTPIMAEPAPPPKPKLIVAIAVDQLSSDLFNEYRSSFTGGLKRLAQGVVFPSGYQGHAATETCPGHSTILTGSRPSRTGVIANDWMDPKLERKDRSGKPTYDVYCAEAPGPVGSAASPIKVSAGFLKVPTLGDRMKAASNATKVVSVSGKDRAAVMMGGHKADLTLWWDGKAFATYQGREGDIPTAVAGVNAKAQSMIDKPSAIKVPAQCESRNRALALTDKLSVGTLKPRAAKDATKWRATPEFDAVALDVALAAQSALRLGKNDGTDLLAVSFSGPDYVGHTYGTAGVEQCVQIAALDATLDRLFKALDASKIPYVVVLTADHGGHDAPERNDVQALPAAQRVDVKLIAATVGADVAKQLGLEGNALIGRAAAGDIYLSAKVPADKRKAALDLTASIYRAHPQIEAVFTKEEIAATPSPTRPVDDWSLIERARASFDPERSGDLQVMLKRYVTPIPSSALGYIATHGSPWDYDRRVPILFWWRGIAGFEQPNGVETVDIMPTLASLTGLTVPQFEIDGRCLDLVAGAQTNCP